MSKRKTTVYAGDFETTVFEGQTYTEVWSSAIVEVYTDDVLVHHSIDETYGWILRQNKNMVIYYHNLKFDGEFWLTYLLSVQGIKQAYEQISDDGDVRFLAPGEMPDWSVKYSISDRQQWYYIMLKTNGHIIEFRDSLKLLPFNLKTIGKGFNTAHQKLDMKYEGFRYAGCPVTPNELEYIKNDVLVLKEALEIMFQDGHDQLTIGSCCMKEFKSNFFYKTYQRLFPELSEVEISKERFNAKNLDEYLRRAYRGGWCYFVPEKTNKVIKHGLTADVNSLYPSVMHSDSGNAYPYGMPRLWKGNYIPKQADEGNKYYFIRVQTRFKLKSGYLPCIQIKGSPVYNSTKWLETSDYYYKGRYYTHYKNDAGEVVEARPILTLTMTDWKLIQEHYDLTETEILDGAYFDSVIGIFDEYINKYRDIKIHSKGAMRTEAKLFLNNLYGKFATNTDSSFRVCFVREDGSLGNYPVAENNKKAGYIAIGAAITSYARDFTIRAAQKNFHGANKPGFCYADTDSIHCDLLPEDLIDIPVDDVAFNHWKLESYWDWAIFVRAKTYIEHITHDNGKQIDKPYVNMKCAGMSERCKELFLKSVEGYTPDENDEYSPVEREYMATKREYTDFKVGLFIPTGKLRPTHIPGGVLLQDTFYTMRRRLGE